MLFRISSRIDRIHGAIRPVVLSALATTFIMLSVPESFTSMDSREKQQLIRTFRRYGRRKLKKLIPYGRPNNSPAKNN